MRKTRTWAACLGVLFLLTLTASSARADSFRADDLIVKANHAEGHFDLFDASRAGMTTFAELFEGNNGLHLGLLKNDNGNHFGLFKNQQDPEFENNTGKHLGFSVASAGRGNKFGLFKGPATSAGGGGTIPNPEPTAVFLLGTGLVAVGAFARRRFRKSDH